MSKHDDYSYKWINWKCAGRKIALLRLSSAMEHIILTIITILNPATLFKVCFLVEHFTKTHLIMKRWSVHTCH